MQDEEMNWYYGVLCEVIGSLEPDKKILAKRMMVKTQLMFSFPFALIAISNQSLVSVIAYPGNSCSWVLWSLVWLMSLIRGPCLQLHIRQVFIKEVEVVFDFEVVGIPVSSSFSVLPLADQYSSRDISFQTGPSFELGDDDLPKQSEPMHRKHVAGPVKLVSHDDGTSTSLHEGDTVAQRLAPLPHRTRDQGLIPTWVKFVPGVHHIYLDLMAGNDWYLWKGQLLQLELKFDSANLWGENTTFEPAPRSPRSRLIIPLRPLPLLNSPRSFAVASPVSNFSVKAFTNRPQALSAAENTILWVKSFLLTLHCKISMCLMECSGNVCGARLDEFLQHFLRLEGPNGLLLLLSSVFLFLFCQTTKACSGMGTNKEAHHHCGEGEEHPTPQPGTAGCPEGPSEARLLAMRHQSVPTTPHFQASGSNDALNQEKIYFWNVPLQKKSGRNVVVLSMFVSISSMTQDSAVLSISQDAHQDKHQLCLEDHELCKICSLVCPKLVGLPEQGVDLDRVLQTGTFPRSRTTR
ncbi:uncharacterized protein LOC125446897 [Stegostoma tigrinum]|uniref:uncharacterized protein LOC125446897 n=1 Tax=Stegostoma tigrinum TaxID=3053191 RepID=UPI00286FE57D|nr:uncharacterized protein LOC125446897 [Stegostoma tigrinum]